jgi:hypothetical protein
MPFSVGKPQEVVIPQGSPEASTVSHSMTIAANN